jgi:Helix-turn-helix domain
MMTFRKVIGHSGSRGLRVVEICGFEPKIANGRESGHGPDCRSIPVRSLAMNTLPHDRFPEFIATKRAAEILGRSPATLKRWRYEGTGPEYVEIEGRVRYDVRVLLDYIKRNTRVPSVRAAMEETRGAA